MMINMRNTIYAVATRQISCQQGFDKSLCSAIHYSALILYCITFTFATTFHWTAFKLTNMFIHFIAWHCISVCCVQVWALLCAHNMCSFWGLNMLVQWWPLPLCSTESSLLQNNFHCLPFIFAQHCTALRFTNLWCTVLFHFCCRDSIAHHKLNLLYFESMCCILSQRAVLYVNVHSFESLHCALDQCTQLFHFCWRDGTANFIFSVLYFR